MPSARTCIALLLLAGWAGAALAEPVALEYELADKDVIVVGRFATVLAVPGPLVDYGLNVLRVEQSVSGPLADGDWFLFPWSFSKYARPSCPPVSNPRSASGILGLMFLDLDGRGRPRSWPMFWSLEHYESLERLRDVLESIEDRAEPLELARQVVLEHLERLDRGQGARRSP